MSYIVTLERGVEGGLDDSAEIGRYESLESARAAVRAELGITRLTRRRAWHNQAEHIEEAWLARLDEDCSDGYFIEACE